jgi:hypothetical protein
LIQTNSASLRNLDKDHLLRDFSALVEKDRRDTATLLSYIAEIDRRKLYLEHACSSMFAFCTKRFHMSEAVAARRIRAGRATCRFPCIFGTVARGELHLSGIHQLAGHLTEDNHEEVLRRAKHKSMREIDKLIAEISPKPDAGRTISTKPTSSTARCSWRRSARVEAVLQLTSIRCSGVITALVAEWPTLEPGQTTHRSRVTPSPISTSAPTTL